MFYKIKKMKQGEMSSDWFIFSKTRETNCFKLQEAVKCDVGGYIELNALLQS